MANANDSAYAMLEQEFEQYGLGGLVHVIQGYATQGLPADQITMNLRQTPEYKARFAANDTRISRGMAALSEADYLAMESQYRGIMRAAGMPTGFYDQQSDFQQWIANDVSPSELADRVQSASDFANNTSDAQKQDLKTYYGIDSNTLTAWALDPARTAQSIKTMADTAKMGGLASEQGLQVSGAYAQGLVQDGVSADQAKSAFNQVATDLPTTKKLSEIDNQTVSTTDLTDAALGRNAAAQLASQQRANRERARFGGQVSSTATTYATSDSGKF